MKLNTHFLLSLLLAVWFASVPAFSAPVGTLRIEHAPITLAVKGQEVLFRAQVKSGEQPVKTVTLYYAVSRDAAPYKVAMQHSGAGWFTGTLSADITTGLNQILYYIEARNAADATVETPWYTIAVKNTGSPAATSPAPAPCPSSSSTPGSSC